MIKQILLIGFIIFSFTACNSNTSSTNTSNDKVVGTKETIKEEQTEVSKENKVYKLKDIVKMNDFTLQIKSIEDNYKEQYMDIAEGNKAVRINLDYENKTNSIAYLSEFTMKTKDNRNAKEVYSADYTANYEISPKSKSEVSLFFEVPQDTKEVIVYYQHGALLNKTLEFNIKF